MINKCNLGMQLHQGIIMCVGPFNILLSYNSAIGETRKAL